MFTFIVINSSGYCVISKCRLEWSFQSKVQVRNSQGESRAFVWCHPATIPKGQKWSGRNQRTTAWPYPETNRRIWDATDASHLSMYPAATGWNRPAASSVLHSRLHWPDDSYRKKKQNFAFLNWILLPKIWKRISDFHILKFLWAGWVKCDPMTSITCRLWNI